MTLLIIWIVGAFVTAAVIGVIDTTGSVIDRADTYFHILLWPFFWLMFGIGVIKALLP